MAKKKHAVICRECGTAFATSGRGIYCKNACRIKAWYKRKEMRPSRPGPEVEDAMRRVREDIERLALPPVERGTRE